MAERPPRIAIRSRQCHPHQVGTLAIAGDVVARRP